MAGHPSRSAAAQAGGSRTGRKLAPGKAATCGRRVEKLAQSGETKKLGFAETDVARWASAVTGWGYGQEGSEAAEVRGLLLPPEHALRPRARQALPNLPARGARPGAGAAARLRLPGRAHDRRVRLPPARQRLKERLHRDTCHGLESAPRARPDPR